MGIVAASGVLLEVLPKIDGDDGKVRKSLVHMLATAWELRVADGEVASLDTQQLDLLEVLISLFSTRLLAAIRRGLPRRYVAHDEDLPKLRGKLDVTRQYTRLLMRPDLLACRYDELSEDAPLNRVFKASVAVLCNQTCAYANVRRLAELSARLEFVGESTAPLREPVRLDRTNTAFHELYQLARTFLRGDWQATTQGESPGFALLFPMNDLFEKFIARKMLVAARGRPVKIQASCRSALCEGDKKRFQLKPDLLVDCNIVIDTKWKELKIEEQNFGVKQSDVYQMLAYANAYKAKRLVLLYPWYDGLGDPGILCRWKVSGSLVPFEIATVDVGEPNSVAEQLRNIVC